MTRTDRSRVLLILVLLFAITYYVARIAVFYAGMTGSMEFEEEQSTLVENLVIYSFLLIGALGLAALMGIYLGRSWGFWGTMAVSTYTIVFDIWAFLMIQSSAIAGVIPALILAGYLILKRSEFIQG